MTSEQALKNAIDAEQCAADARKRFDYHANKALLKIAQSWLADALELELQEHNAPADTALATANTERPA